ncbi:MAG: hypothetical protein LBV72_07820 [Tannerella sp.]|nr:hypothetical protein [Tannerella sp.]
MSRREELEKEVEIARKRLDQAPLNISEEVLEAYRKEHESLTLELNNLYDDDEDEQPG